MIKQKIQDKIILIPALVSAEDFQKGDEMTNTRYGKSGPSKWLTFAVLPKDYTLMSVNIEVLEAFDGVGTAEIAGIDFNIDDLNEAFTAQNCLKIASGIDVSKGSNSQSSVVTTLKKNQPLSLVLSEVPTTGKAIIRVMMFAPSSTYIEI